MKNQLITDTTTALLTQANIGDDFRADFAKAIAAVFDAGAATATTKVISSPLSDAEIAAFRASLLNP